jgi:hypothetical protein
MKEPKITHIVEHNEFVISSPSVEYLKTRFIVKIRERNTILVSPDT